MANGDGQDPGAFGPDAGRKVHIHEPGRGGVGATVGAVAGGDLVVLNKIDLVDAETLAQVHEWIDSIRPGVQVFETTRCRLPMEILLGTGAADPKRVAPGAELGVHVHQVSAATESQSHDRDHDHRLLFDTWTFSTDVPIQMGLLQQILSHLTSTVFRVKGFVHTIEEPQSRMVLQLIGRRATVTPTRSWGAEQPQTWLVFISRHGTVNYPAIEKALNSCRVEG